MNRLDRIEGQFELIEAGKVMSREDRHFIAQWARSIITNIVMVGAWIMAYFVTRELVADYPQSDWLRHLPMVIAVTGTGFLIGETLGRAWEWRRWERRAENTFYREHPLPKS